MHLNKYAPYSQVGGNEDGQCLDKTVVIKKEGSRVELWVPTEGCVLCENRLNLKHI